MAPMAASPPKKEGLLLPCLPDSSDQPPPITTAAPRPTTSASPSNHHRRCAPQPSPPPRHPTTGQPPLPDLGIGLPTSVSSSPTSARPASSRPPRPCPAELAGDPALPLPLSRVSRVWARPSDAAVSRPHSADGHGIAHRSNSGGSD
jgi:hypothetical protein